MLESSLLNAEDKLGHRAVIASQNCSDILGQLWAVLSDYEVSTCNTNFQADSKLVLFVNSDIILHNFSWRCQKTAITEKIVEYASKVIWAQIPAPLLSTG